MYPKTDQQRQSLTEAVSKSFLFRTLDKEQCQEVLDAMFEKKVHILVLALSSKYVL